MVTEKEDDLLRRHEEIKESYEERGKCVLNDFVGFYADRARDAYILGMPDVCSFLSGKSLEEALSIEYNRKKRAR